MIWEFVTRKTSPSVCANDNARLSIKYSLDSKHWKNNDDKNLLVEIKLTINFNGFYTPVFRRDVLWYGDVRPGLRPSDSPSVRPSDSPSVSPSASFPHFSPTFFDILSCNFAHYFVLMYYRSSLSVVTLRQFLKELCLFVNLEYRKYAVFRTFLLHALTYWAEILYMTLFYCTSDQVWVSSFCVNFWRSYASFWT